jgi:hypothetical protein
VKTLPESGSWHRPSDLRSGWQVLQPEGHWLTVRGFPRLSPHGLAVWSYLHGPDDQARLTDHVYCRPPEESTR